MAEAWQARDYERQKLVENLMSFLYEAEDEFLLKKEGEGINGSGFMVLMSMQLLKYLLVRENNFGLLVKAEFNQTVAKTGEKVMDTIRANTRSVTETQFLLAKLIEKTVASSLVPAYSEMSREEFEYPERIFHTKSRMDEVDV